MLFWRTVWMVLRRTGRLLSTDAFLPLPQRSRSFRRWVIFLAVMGVGGGMFCAVSTMAGHSARLRDESPAEALLLPLVTVGVLTVLYYAAFVLMMRVVQWLSVPASAVRERQWQAMIRSDYLSAPLVLFLTLLLTSLGLLLGEDAHRPVLIVMAVQAGAIVLYWMVVTLVGLHNLTGRSGGAMVWAGVRLVVAWLIILATMTALPFSVLLWVAMIGLL